MTPLASALAQESGANRTVTFQDVLKDPDNPEINFLYAQAQIQAGRLDRAVAALERVLLVQPELTNVRLLYAIVLYRLDNLEEARAALLSLKAENLPADQAAEVDKFLNAIEQRKKTTVHTVSVSVGKHYDSNRNAAPTTGTLLVLDTEIDTDEEASDYGTIISVAAETRHDPGTQRGHQLYAQATAYTDQQATIDSLDLAYGAVALGGVIVTDYGNLDLSAGHARVSLEHTAYTYTNSLTAELTRRLSNDVMATIEQSMQRQIYVNSGDSTTTSDKSGDTFETELGLTYKIDQQNTFSPSLTYKKKNAKVGYESYRAFEFDLSLTRVFTQGLYATAGVVYETTQYRDADTFVSSDRRNDQEFTYSLTSGVPLGGLAVLTGGDGGDDWIPEAVRPVVLIGSVERYTSESNILNYTNDNWKAQLLLSRTFQF